MTLTPSTKGALLAGFGFWSLAWLAVLKLDDFVGETMLKRWVSTERCTRWISQHRSTTLLGTEVCNYSLHGISQPDGVVFALAGTLVNAAVIYLLLPLRDIAKRGGTVLNL